MPSTFFGLNIGVSGLYTYQAALNTTGHNVANAETQGYTRQRVIQQASRPISMNASYGMVGTGVDATEIIQIRDKYYDMKYWSNSTIQGEYGTKFSYMTRIENHFNEITLNGFTTTFDRFYDSLQELHKDVSSLPARTQIGTVGESFTDYFNELSRQLTDLQEDTNFEIKNQVDKINSISDQIAKLSKQINTVEMGGENANDLRDKRALLVDQLSQIASVKVEEQEVGTSDVGVSNYIVYLDGHTLVDGENVNKLEVLPRKEKNNLNDIDGLYEVKWATGQNFNINSPTLGGTLKALIELRDGNNDENFRGTGLDTYNGNPVNAKGDNKFVIGNVNINNISKLNIPPSGNIIIGNDTYKYNGFTATKAADGTYTFELDLAEPLKESAVGEQAKIGESINYKGLPYYKSKLNEFVRTFSSEFNKLHNSGVDLDGNKGLDFFNTVDPITGKNYTLEENPNQFSSYTGSYYSLTAANITITKEILENPRKFAAASDIIEGVENKDVLDKILKLKTDVNMFKQGTPAAFVQTLFNEIGVDTRKAKDFAESQENIMASVTNQRLSVSGVDKEEEAMDLMKFKQAYDLSAKVVSVMNEILDTLINRTGV